VKICYRQTGSDMPVNECPYIYPQAEVNEDDHRDPFRK
jgi:hypothetical protein